MTSPYQFTRLLDDQRIQSSSLAEILESKDLGNERWLFVSPHDDDACMGGGLWMQAAMQSGVDCHLLVVTDGRMGYCTLEERQTIVQVRRTETIESCAALGLPESNVHFLGYPDTGLSLLMGRRPEAPGETGIQGYMGLQNAFTWYLRQVRPSRVLVPSPADYHPDHQVTHNELMISLFHASGNIWPELGGAHPVPELYEIAVYCDFSTPPNLEVHVDERVFQKKLDAIAAYKSQAQIGELVAAIRDAGPYEYLLHVDYRFYDSRIYRSRFHGLDDE